MDSAEFLNRANTFLNDFEKSLHLHAEPPEAPDFSAFKPSTPEHFTLIEQTLARCQELAATAQSIRDRSAAALAAPRLVRSESLEAGRTLFTDA